MSNAQAREAQRQINQIRQSSEYKRLSNQKGYSRRLEVLNDRITNLQKAANHIVPAQKVKLSQPKISPAAQRALEQRQAQRAAAVKAAEQRRATARTIALAKRTPKKAGTPKKAAPKKAVPKASVPREEEFLQSRDELETVIDELEHDEASTDVDDVEDLDDIEEDLPAGRDTTRSLLELENDLDDLELEDDLQ